MDFSSSPSALHRVLLVAQREDETIRSISNRTSPNDSFPGPQRLPGPARSRPGSFAVKGLFVPKFPILVSNKYLAYLCRLVGTRAGSMLS